MSQLNLFRCPACKDTGWIGWYKPMGMSNSQIDMVFVPQVCICEAGLQRFQLQDLVIDAIGISSWHDPRGADRR